MASSQSGKSIKIKINGDETSGVLMGMSRSRHDIKPSIEGFSKIYPREKFYYYAQFTIFKHEVPNGLHEVKTNDEIAELICQAFGLGGASCINWLAVPKNTLESKRKLRTPAPLSSPSNDSAQDADTSPSSES